MVWDVTRVDGDPVDAIDLAARAETLLAEGALVAALETVAEAVSVFYELDHVMLPAAVALEAEILVRAGGEATPFGELAGIDEACIGRIATEAGLRASKADPTTAHGIMGALDAFVTSHLGPAHGIALRVRAARARSAPDAETRRAVLGSLIEALELAGAVDPLVEALLERGAIEAETDEVDAAIVTHERAIDVAREATDRAVRARALRYYALLLLDAEQFDEAKMAIERAHLEAESSTDERELARIVATHGVVLIHAGWFDAAAAMLKRAEAVLDWQAPERAWVNAHRVAVEGGVRPALGARHLAAARARAEAEVKP